MSGEAIDAGPMTAKENIGTLRLLAVLNTLPDKQDEQVELLNVLCAAVRAEAVAEQAETVSELNDLITTLTAESDEFDQRLAAVRAEAVAGERVALMFDNREYGPFFSKEAAMDYGCELAAADQGPIHEWHTFPLIRPVAAGAVPVATPEPIEPYRACAGCDGPDLCKFCGMAEHAAASPVPAVPDEIDCPQCNDGGEFDRLADGRLGCRFCGHAFPGPVATPTEPEGRSGQCGVYEAAGPTRRCRLDAGHHGRCHLTDQGAASPVPAESAEPPAASWDDLAADVMGLVDRALDGEPPVPTEQPAPWFRETRESLAMLDEVRAEVAAVEAAAEQPEER